MNPIPHRITCDADPYLKFKGDIMSQNQALPTCSTGAGVLADMEWTFAADFGDMSADSFPKKRGEPCKSGPEPQRCQDSLNGPIAPSQLARGAAETVGMGLVIYIKAIKRRR
ncbi:hypothetical protein TrVFT333_010244 [Trichoderma virens FT-333]|nr:hypothetical protein TrVFT333_010244 [Trichoderma virens FT-333]